MHQRENINYSQFGSGHIAAYNLLQVHISYFGQSGGLTEV